MSASPLGDSHGSRSALAYPFAGHWLVQNSPANRTPSYGTHAFAPAYAIDFVPVTDSGRRLPISLSTLVRPEPADRFPGFSRPVLAPVEGVVLAAHDSEPDHSAYRGLPSIHYALTQHRRAAAGWLALAGNHIFIDSVVVALCHSQQGSAQVTRGQLVQVRDVLGRCGNSGNSIEPHVHLQAIDNPDTACVNAVRLTFNGSLPVNDEVIYADEPHRRTR